MSTSFGDVAVRDIAVHVVECSRLIAAPLHRTADRMLFAPDHLTVTYRADGPVEVVLAGVVVDPRHGTPAWPGDVRTSVRLTPDQVPWWAEEFVAAHWPDPAARAVLPELATAGSTR